MKIPNLSTLLLGGFTALLGVAIAQLAPAPTNALATPATNAAPVAAPGQDQAPASTNAPATPATNAAPAAAPGQDLAPVTSDQPPPAPAKPEAKPAAEAAPARPAAVVTPVMYMTTNRPGELRLNFRNAPLELVLNYLSDAAGFIIVPETEIKGKVDAWSNQPITQDEAVELLNTVLNKNGYALLRSGRTLTVVNREDARRRDIPVKVAPNDATQIPKTDEMVTSIIPVRYINASQLVKNLQPLLTSTDALTANDSGNALILTDTQINVRRMVEIVHAIDTPLNSVSSVRVFPLKFADAKTLATVIKDLFQPQQSSGGGPGNPGFGGGRLLQMMRGGGPGGGGDRGGDRGGDQAGGGRAPTPRVVATSDDRSNSLIVSAPAEQMPLVEEVVNQVDVDVQDVMELHVFHLKFADAQEMSDMLLNLFPDPTTSQSSSRGQFRFGGMGGPFGMRPGGMRPGGAADQSSRVLQQQKVTAVPDLRTRSVVVSASHTLMPQITLMVEELDADPAMKKKVFVFSVENTDPEQVQQVIEQLFPNTGYNAQSSNYRRNSTQQTGRQLNNRATTMQNQGGRGSGGGSFGGTPRMGQ